MEGSNINPAIKVFEVNREARYPRDSWVIPEDATAWEIYNHKASEIDREFIKDCNDSLNTLLIFTALYSAVLTSFIVESMKLLKEDTSDVSRDILLIISKQLANNSFPPFEAADHTVSSYAVVVNGLLFTSLLCALVAALLAVLALQWIASYDMGLNTTSARKRALQRHLRWMGIKKWKMAEIIASLPLLIFAALFLFFIGVATWLWYLNRTISVIVIGGIGIAILLYAVTNVIGIVYVDAPFRTPISKGLFAAMRSGFTWSKMIPLTLLHPSTRYGHMWGKSRVEEYTESEEVRDKAHSEGMTLGQTFAKREEATFERDYTIIIDSLMWLANGLEVSSASLPSFRILIARLTELPAEFFMNTPRIHDAPWEAIFGMMCAPYFGKRKPEDYTAAELKEARFLCSAMSMVSRGIISPVLRTFYESLENSEDKSLSASAWMARYRQRHMAARVGRSPLIRAFQHACQSVHQIDPNYFHFILLNIQERWSILWANEIVYSSTQACGVLLSTRENAPKVHIISIPSVKIILDLVARSISSGTVKGDTPQDRYVATLQRVKEEDYTYETMLRFHRAVQQQLLAHISCTNLLSPNGYSDLRTPLDLLLSIVGSSRLALGAREKDAFIWIMAKVYREYKDEIKLDGIEDALLTGLLYSFTDPDSPKKRDPWTNLVLELDDYISRRRPLSRQDYSSVIQVIMGFSSRSFHNDHNIDSSSSAALIRVQDPCIAWALSWDIPGDLQFQALLNARCGTWDPDFEDEVVQTLGYRNWRAQNVIHSRSRIEFLRNIILDGSSKARTVAVQVLNHYLRRKGNEEQWEQVLSSPVLNRIFEHCTQSSAYRFHELFGYMIRYRWFYGEFSKANGLEWLPLIALNGTETRGGDASTRDRAIWPDHVLDDVTLQDLLIDQVIFSSANERIGPPLNSLYHYLLSIGTRSTRHPEDSSESFRMITLRHALSWVLDKSIKVQHSIGSAQDSPNDIFNPETFHFAKVGLRKLYRYKWSSLGQIRSFDFVKDMSKEEWEEWITHIKVMLMGTTLNGLRSGPTYDSHRFSRDPDGVCGFS
ncbi:hypothetical protein CPB86DRAFT_822594 [Serendipita vermifera]|nr:hypothetical protein CPB86DRAFT_822594 [Serendipita vermifera]